MIKIYFSKMSNMVQLNIKKLFPEKMHYSIIYDYFLAEIFYKCCIIKNKTKLWKESIPNLLLYINSAKQKNYFFTLIYLPQQVHHLIFIHLTRDLAFNGIDMTSESGIKEGDCQVFIVEVCSLY